MKIISIGDLVTDFYYKDNKLVGVCGGMTSHNIIANIAKSGIDTAVYGACGNDETGKIAIQSLKDLGVDTTNIKIIDDINTRAFHVSYNTTNEGIKFVSKKRCPFCNKKKWYDESMIDTKDIINVYKEYEFSYEKDDNYFHGIIDLILEYEDKIKIIDYKLKNIDDENYDKQIKTYKEYLSTKTNKKIETYLFSILKEKLEEK